MRGHEGLQLPLDLLCEDRRGSGRRDEAEEGRGGVERASAEFGVRLEAHEEGVVCGGVSVKGNAGEVKMRGCIEGGGSR